MEMPDIQVMIKMGTNSSIPGWSDAIYLLFYELFPIDSMSLTISVMLYLWNFSQSARFLVLLSYIWRAGCGAGDGTFPSCVGVDFGSGREGCEICGWYSLFPLPTVFNPLFPFLLLHIFPTQSESKGIDCEIHGFQKIGVICLIWLFLASLSTCRRTAAGYLKLNWGEPGRSIWFQVCW